MNLLDLVPVLSSIIYLQKQSPSRLGLWQVGKGGWIFPALLQRLQ